MKLTDPTLADLLREVEDDPYLFVQSFYPWGVGDLVGSTGPEPWQRKVLEQIRDGLKSQSGAIRIAVASGHGVGKSALIAWIMQWAFLTKVGTRGVATANTESQLKTKTWAELTTWYNRLQALGSFLKINATSITSVEPDHERSWRIDAIPWSLHKPEAFAGLHNRGKRIVLLFDEASGIPAPIWDVSEGAMTDTDTQIIWLVFGNPTQNIGKFYDCFGRNRKRWITHRVDSRDVTMTNKIQIQQWIDDEGDDSDFVRVRVRGLFPRLSTYQLISQEMVDAAVDRRVQVPRGTPKLMGVDVARFGGDMSVIARRHGRKLEPLIKYRGIDTMAFANEIAQAVRDYHPDVIFVEETGIGAGVVDRLRQLGFTIIGVNPGSSPSHLWKDKTRNHRAEMWLKIRDWISGADIPNDQDLKMELTAQEYSESAGSQKIQLTAKQDMKSHGLPSPDCADALAMTFSSAVPIKLDSFHRSYTHKAPTPVY